MNHARTHLRSRLWCLGDLHHNAFSANHAVLALFTFDEDGLAFMQLGHERGGDALSCLLHHCSI